MVVEQMINNDRNELHISTVRSSGSRIWIDMLGRHSEHSQFLVVFNIHGDKSSTFSRFLTN